MQYDAYAERLLRVKREEGKRAVVLAGDNALLAGIAAEKVTLRVIGRVNVAFLTPAELAEYVRQGGVLT